MRVQSERAPDIQLSPPKSLDWIQTLPKAHTTWGSCLFHHLQNSYWFLSLVTFCFIFCHYIFLTPSPSRELYPHALSFIMEVTFSCDSQVSPSCPPRVTMVLRPSGQKSLSYRGISRIYKLSLLPFEGKRYIIARFPTNLWKCLNNLHSPIKIYIIIRIDRR